MGICLFKIIFSIYNNRYKSIYIDKTQNIRRAPIPSYLGFQKYNLLVISPEWDSETEANL